MRDPRAFAKWIVGPALLVAAGCPRREAPRERADAAPPVVEVSPAPSAWTFARVRTNTGLALPDRCALRAPTTRAAVSAETRFVAEPRSLGLLVIADARGGAERLAGAGAMRLDPEGISRDPAPLPWIAPASLPRLARAGARWIAAIDRAPQVTLWRGGEAETIGEGDGFEAVDLACGEDRCALVTTRPLAVAAPGAVVWIGSPREPAGRWQRSEIAPRSTDAEPHALGIAAFDAAEGRAKIAVIDRAEIVAHEVVAGAVKEIARVAAPHGALDVIAAPKLAAMGSATAVDDAGCARDGKPGVRFAREGAANAVDFALPAPPSRGSIRPLSRGSIATWIAPVGCRMERRVVYAVMLDEEGAPMGAPVPVGDASSFAAASQGDDVDLWLANASEVTWVRARCSPR